MRSRASVGLFVVAMSASPLALAHAPGVTHTYENGQPVITVRLVPDEAVVAKAKRMDALDPAAAHTAPSEEPGIASAGPVETVEPAASEDFAAPLGAEPANALPSAEAATATGAEAVSRYPTAKPALKPNTETGVGGVLDLAPPSTEEAQPRPMRLNSVQRPRNVADRTPRAQPRPRPQRANPAPALPSEPDPLDEALPSRVVDAPAPVNAMQLPPPKAEERIAGGN